MRIGARVWKTALAVAISLAVSRLLGFHYPVFAGVAAVICMQPTVYGTLRAGKERMQATIIGVVFALLALIIMQHVPALQVARSVIAGLTVLVVMAVIIRLRWFDSLVLGAATVVVVMVLPSDENIYYYSASRAAVTFIGILVATTVNALLLTPRYRAPLWQGLGHLARVSGQLYGEAVQAFCRRDLALARHAQDLFEQSEEAERAVATRLQWLDEEMKLRRAIRLQVDEEIRVLHEAARVVAAVRRSGAAIARVTAQILEREPRYAKEPARAYEILWELAQPSFHALDHLEAHLSGQAPPAEEAPEEWTDEVHRTLIKAIREAYVAPRDIFPLVEVAVVAFEVRHVTEIAVGLARGLHAPAL